MKRIFLALSLVTLLGTSFSAFGLGLIVVPEQEGWHPPQFRMPSPRPPRNWPAPRPYLPLEVNFAKVNARINDQVAVTTVEQEFYNPSDARLEGTFMFPVPKGAHLDKFTMEIDGKPVEAELLDAAKARGIYEDIVRKMRDPALLEYSGQDVFKVRIYPIEPRSTKRVKLSYTQLLKSDGGLVGYTLPLGTEKFSAKPLKSVSVKVELETQRPLKTVYSPSHDVEVRRNGAQRATAGYEAKDVQPEDDFTLYFATEKDDLGINLLTYKTGDGDGYFLLLASPGAEVKEKNIVAKDVVFVLDTSGSMAGKKLEQAKKALQFCVENLNSRDHFEILRFSTEVEPLFDKLTEATTKNRERAGDFIKDLRAIGGTAIDDALKKALAMRPETGDRPFVVIFLTDGRPTIGTSDEDTIVAHVKSANEGRTRVFCFGIGTDVNTHLLDKITEETRAVSQYVLPEEDLEVKVSNFYSKIKEPVLANPTLKFTGDVRAAKLYPSALPDVFKGDQLVLVGRYSGHGDSAVIVEGSVNGEKKKFTYEVRFPDESTKHEFIPRLWATRRVGYLLDEIRLRGESSELRDEVTDLARQYGIVTPYTAYLIVEDERKRDVPVAMQSLPQMNADAPVFNAAQDSFYRMNTDKDGINGVSAARASSELRLAKNAPSGMGGGGGGGRGGSGEQMRSFGAVTAAATPPAEAKAKVERMEQYTQQQRFVNGRNFFQNGNQWVDSSVQKQQNAKRVRVQFNSTEYFELVRKQPQALPWLALGQNVQFVLDNTIYEIYE
jgi:Ca-activated chloride channel family protein